MQRLATRAIDLHTGIPRTVKPQGSSDRTVHKNIFQTILESPNTPQEEKEGDRMAQEAFLLMAAGGETTARVLTAATFHLLENETSGLARLKEELLEVMPDADARVEVKVLEKLPWLVSPTPSCPTTHNQFTCNRRPLSKRPYASQGSSPRDYQSCRQISHYNTANGLFQQG